MKNGDRMLLLMGWCLLVIGMIILICQIRYRTDQLNSRIESISHKIEEIHDPAVDPATATDAITTYATPAEPNEVEMELLECFQTPSEPQKDTESSEVDQTAPKKEEAKEEASESQGELEYVGVYELTAYAWTGNPCANGNYPTTGYTVASNFFPLGTRLYIEGMGEYVVEDRGGMADNVIDIYMGDYDTCIQFGRKQAGIFIVSGYNK